MEKNKTLFKLGAIVLSVTIVVLSILLFIGVNPEQKQSGIPLIIGLILAAGFQSGIIFWLLSENTETESSVKKSENILSETPLINSDNPIMNTADVDYEFVELLKSKTNQAFEPAKVAEQLLITISKKYAVVQGMLFLLNSSDGKFYPKGNYAFYSNEAVKPFSIGEGITGQVAKNQETLKISNVPHGYITVLSGLGSSSPRFLLLVPFVHNGQTVAVAEFASFSEFPDSILKIFELINNEYAAAFEKLSFS